MQIPTRSNLITKNLAVKKERTTTEKSVFNGTKVLLVLFAS